LKGEKMARFSNIQSMLTNTKPPICLGHRGSSGYAPENTLPAFELAVRQGADMLELDVTLSKDGEVVVIHDDTVDRTSDGSGLVNNLTVSELKKLDFGSWFARAYAGVRIPTLAEVLDLVKGRCLLDIELKAGVQFNRGAINDQRINDSYEHAVTKMKASQIKEDVDTFPTLGQAVLSRIDDFGMQDQAVLSGFSAASLESLKKYRSKVACGLSILPEDITREAQFAADCGMELVFPQVYSGTPEYVAYMHSLGLKVYICVYDAEQSIVERLLQAGVDGIMSNYPEKLDKFREGVS
jgi:glycerophosphoryl diester phosphodiesterase